MWMELFEAYIISSDATFAEDRPFAAHIIVTTLDDLAFFECGGTLTSYARTSQHVAADARNELPLSCNFGGGTILSQQLGREMALKKGEMGLYATGDPGAWYPQLGACVKNVMVPRDALGELIPNPDDQVMRKMNPESPATRLLQFYLELVFEPNGMEDDPALTTHVSRTVTDLVALALGASRDAAEVAQARGVRAARLQLVLSSIKSNYDDPQFTAHTLAANLGLSLRYIQVLLNETGATFSERVLELRLQKARRMLSDARNNTMKISDIAYACGFNEVSYFYRCFRRRFGASPTQYRQD